MVVIQIKDIMGRGRIIILPTPMIRKQAGQMRKLLGLWDNSKLNKTGILNKSNPQPVITDGRPAFLTQEKGIKQTYISRRQMVLNRHFTEIISDELSTNMKKQLTDLGVSITSIETKAWNKGVNIFYYSRKPFDQKVHSELNTLVADLRYAISQLRPMGRVPLLNFVYDDTVRLEQELLISMSNVKTIEVEENKDVAEFKTTTQLQYSKGLCNDEKRLDPKKFSSPPDMKNVMLGLDYPSLYDEVSAKLERGRAISTRMIPQTTLASSSKPFIRGPIENLDNDDTIQRVSSMRKFLVSQRKKAEYHAKLRRKKELLARDDVKWDLPNEEDVSIEEMNNESS